MSVIWYSALLQHVSSHLLPHTTLHHFPEYGTASGNRVSSHLLPPHPAATAHSGTIGPTPGLRTCGSSRPPLPTPRHHTHVAPHALAQRGFKPTPPAPTDAAQERPWRMLSSDGFKPIPSAFADALGWTCRCHGCRTASSHRRYNTASWAKQ